LSPCRTLSGSSRLVLRRPHGQVEPPRGQRHLEADGSASRDKGLAEDGPQPLPATPEANAGELLAAEDQPDRFDAKSTPTASAAGSGETDAGLDTGAAGVMV